MISGFCLALQQLRQEPGSPRGRQLVAYFLGRFARIVPAYWAAVLFSAAICVGLRIEAPTQTLEDVGLHLFFLHGLDRTRFLNLNGALWSMVTEVQFYLLFPWLFRLLTRMGGARFLVVTGVVNLFSRMAFDAYPFADGVGGGVSTAALLSCELPGRLWEFALGMALAERYLRQLPADDRLFKWAWAPSLVLAIGCRLSSTVLPDLAFGLFYACLLGAVLFGRTASVGRPGPLQRFMSSWGARFGRSSYSFFLLHVPILVGAIARISGSDPARPYAMFVRVAAAGLPLSIGAGVAL